MRTLLSVTAAVALAMALSIGSASATSLTFNGGSGGTLSFTAAVGNQLTITGAPLATFSIVPDPSPPNFTNAAITSGSLSLTSGVATSGSGTSWTFGSGGSLTLAGTNSTLGITSGTLMTGTFLSGGTASLTSPGKYQANFQVTGMDPTLLTDAFGPSANVSSLSGLDFELLINVASNGATPGVFSGTVGSTDIGVVPEPGSLALLGIAMLGAALVWGKKLKSSEEVEC